jgi:hypothetical protein
VRQEFGKIRDDDIGAVLSKRRSLIAPVDADHQSEASRMSSSDAGQRIFNHNRPLGLDRQAPRPFKKCVGSRFAWKVKPVDIVAVDAGLK